MSGVWQQVFALDARFNSHRSPHQSNFRTMYIRRRNQLLRKFLEKAEHTEDRKKYMETRSMLLQRRYNADDMSFSSLNTTKASDEWDSASAFNAPAVVPTRNAAASRALVGGTTIAQNYAFAGVAHIFDQHTQAVTCLKFAHSDKDRLLCAGDDGLVSICSVSPPSVLHVLRGHVGPVTCCDWSADSEMVVSGGRDGMLRLWNSRTGACLRTTPLPQPRIVLTSQQNPQLPASYLCSCVFQPANNNILITGDSTGTVSLMNTSAGIFPKGCATKIGGAVLSLCCDARGLLLWAGTDRGTVTSLAMTSRGLTRLSRVMVCANRPVTCLSYRQWVSREARDPTLLVSCAANAVFLYRVRDNEGGIVLKNRLPIKHETQFVSSTFCPIMSFREGACIVTCSEDSSVYVLDVERTGDKAIINRLQGHSCAALGVSFNYDESLLATSDMSGLVILWTKSSK